MKKKLQLKDLKVKSFMTHLPAEQKAEIVGGLELAIDSSCGIPDCACD